MSDIGTHIRITEHINPVDVAQKLNLKIFQSFLIFEESNLHIKPYSLYAKYIKSNAKNFKTMYAHASYLINLAHSNNNITILEKEINLCRFLGYKYLIIHPGSFKKNETLQIGLENICRNLNLLFKNYDNEIKIVLENIAFQGRAIGGNLDEFYFIKSNLDKPEMLNFCFDTTHAFAYGYDLTNDSIQDQILTKLKNHFEIDGLPLLHLNDSFYDLKSNLDKHCIPGTGKIGFSKLYNLAKKFNKDIICELPANSSENDILEILNKLNL